MSRRFTIYLMFQPFFDKSKSPLEKMGIKTLGALKSKMSLFRCKPSALDSRSLKSVFK